MRPLLISVVILSLGGCFVGPSVGGFPPAQGPEGIAADLHLKDARVRGELLEVQDTAIVVLREQRVVFVPLEAIDYGTFRQRGTLIVDGRFFDEAAAAKLRLVSRFPAGLSPERRAALLAAYGQSEPDRVSQ